LYKINCTNITLKKIILNAWDCILKVVGNVIVGQ